MKKSDIAMIVLIAGVSVAVAFSLGSVLNFMHPPEDGVKVDTVEAIEPDVQEPDPKVFNKDAINPTVKTVIGTGSNAPR